MKTLLGLLVAMLVATAFYLAPLYVAERIKDSIAANDVEALESYVSWDSVRSDVTSQLVSLTDVQSQRNQAPQSLGDVFGDVAREALNGFKNLVVGSAVDAFVTPQWVVAVAHGTMPDLGDQVSNTLLGPVWRYVTQDTLSNPRARADVSSRISTDWAYESLSVFVITVHYQLDSSGPPVRIGQIGMERDGWFSWRVTHVTFEDDLRALAARVNAIELAQERAREARLRNARREEQAREAAAAQEAANAAAQLGAGEPPSDSDLVAGADGDLPPSTPGADTPAALFPVGAPALSNAAP